MRAREISRPDPMRTDSMSFRDAVWTIPEVRHHVDSEMDKNLIVDRGIYLHSGVGLFDGWHPCVHDRSNAKRA